MPEVLPVLVGLVAGSAGLVLASVLKSTNDALAVGAVVLAAFLGGAGLAPLAVVVAVALVVGAAQLLGPLRWVVGAAAAVLLGVAVPAPASLWLGVAATVAVVVAVPMVELGRRGFGPGATLALLTLAPLAVYTAVPDTEEVTAVGVTLLVVTAGYVLSGRQPSTVGISAFVALIVWATAVGARGREAAFVSVACFAILFVGPLAYRLKRWVQWRSPVGVALAMVHLVAALAIARWAGVRHDISGAVVRALLVTAVAALAGGVLIRSSPRAEV